MEDNFCV